MIRILHIVGAMNRGGIENWLMNVLRNIDRNQFQLDFLVHATDAGAFDDEIRALGGDVISCPRSKRPLAYAKRLRSIFNQNGPYDVLHSHVHHFSGYTVRLAHKAGIPVRIAHSHSDTRKAEVNAKWVRQTYLYCMNKWIAKHATCGLANSEGSADSLFGDRWRQDPRWTIFPCGLDVSPFECLPPSSSIAKEAIGVPADRLVVGHVGRFVTVKNHTFVIDVFEALLKEQSTSHLVLVGEGPLESEIKEKVRRAKLADHVTFAGVQSDVAPYYSAMDCNLFPSHYEGQGLVVLEALAAGTPTLASRAVPRETEVIPGRVRFLSLEKSAEDWATELAQMLQMSKGIPSECSRVLEQSKFGMERCLRDLTAMYCPARQSSSD